MILMPEQFTESPRTVPYEESPKISSSNNYQPGVIFLQIVTEPNQPPIHIALPITSLPLLFALFMSNVE